MYSVLSVLSVLLLAFAADAKKPDRAAVEAVCGSERGSPAFGLCVAAVKQGCAERVSRSCDRKEANWLKNVGTRPPWLPCPDGTTEVGGYCWAPSGMGQDCELWVCDGRLDLTYDQAGGDWATDGAACKAVLDALEIAPVGSGVDTTLASPAAGCVWVTSNGYRKALQNTPTDAFAALAGHSRACACR